MGPKEFKDMMDYLTRPRMAQGGRIRFQGGTDIKTGQGFQQGNPGNPQSLRELNISRKSEQDSRVTRFKELVKSGSTPNEAKKNVIEQFNLNRNPKAGTPVWMTKGKEELIAEGFDYQASARGPKNVGGVEKAAQKRKQVIGEGRKFEERVKRTKQKTGFGKKFELAHTANIFQAKKLDIDYPIDALAIQATEVNQVIAEGLNDELKPLYSKQLKLVNKMKRKNTPSLQKELDKINFKISELVATGGKQGSKAANVLKPIIVDPMTLKGNILNLGFDTSTELMASPGATTKATIAGSPDDLMARANVGQKLFQKVPGITDLFEMAKTIPGDVAKKSYLKAGFKTLGIAATPLVIFDTYKAFEQGKPLLESLEQGFIGTDFIGGTKRILALTPEERTARSVVKQDPLKDLNLDMPMGFGFIEGPTPDSNLTLEEAQAKLAAGVDRVKQLEAQKNFDRATKRANFFGNLKDKAVGIGPDYQLELAGGGIAKMAGVSSGPPPQSGPNSQGLPGLLKRGRII
tara:strand:- start:39 stop:1592 length:1554 start_codon:yes stop_codon:yes gene_type:complete